ncbi:hypothetical protein F5Y03DRAFT_410872 [Xylaria venustula]|nr:hypothetical protein F5Y03DRAFT_410872 [Xylaria venustula]
MNTSLALAVLSLLASFGVNCQQIDETIVSCYEAGCPSSATVEQSYNCTVADRTFDYIGLRNISTAQNSLYGLSWTRGIEHTDTNRPNFDTDHFAIRSSFYLGTPPNFNLTGTGACAVFINGISSRLYSRSMTGHWTCSDAMSQTCVRSLINTAKIIVGGLDSGTPSADACSKLQESLLKDLDQSCLALTNDSINPWFNNLDAIPLSGTKNVPQPITSKQNSTSTCWPVLPKHNGLSLVNEYSVNLKIDAPEEIGHAFLVTPILTVLYPLTDKSIIDEPDISMSCLKIMVPGVFESLPSPDKPKHKHKHKHKHGYDYWNEGDSITSPSPLLLMIITMLALLAF